MRVIFFLAVVALAVSGFEDHLIRCEVCKHAMTYLWDQGRAMQDACDANPKNDTLCDRNGIVKREPVQALVASLCERLPETHHMGMDSTPQDEKQFWMERHPPAEQTWQEGPPRQSDEVMKAVHDSCVAWVHEEHTLDHLTDKIHQHHVVHHRGNRHSDASMRHGMYMAHCAVAACQPDGSYEKGSHRATYLAMKDGMAPADFEL